MIKSVLLIFIKNEETVTAILMFFYVFLSAAIIFISILGSIVYPNIKWSPLTISFAAALILLVADLFYGIKLDFDKLQKRFLNGIKALVQSHSRVKLFTGEEYIDLARCLIKGHIGDIAFINVSLNMFENEKIFDLFWKEGILTNDQLLKVVIVPNKKQENITKIIQNMRNKDHKFKDWYDQKKISFKSINDIELPFNFETMGGLVCSSTTEQGFRRSDHIFLFVQNELFSNEEHLYKGFFLFFSSKFEKDVSIKPFFEKIDDWINNIHD